MVAKTGQSDLGSPSCSTAADRKKWERICVTYLEAIKSEQSKNQTLLEERESLVQYIHAQHERWSSRCSLLNMRIVQMKKQETRMKRNYATKIEFVIKLKEKETALFKNYSELDKSDLEEYNACIRALSAENLELKSKFDNTESLNPTKSELKNLKQAYKTLSAEKESQVSALLAEKNFVWNQLKKKEQDYANLLKSKKLELNQANDKADNLQKSLEEMDASISEKDGVISRLTGEVDDLKRIASKKDKIISKLTAEKESRVSGQLAEKDSAIDKLKEMEKYHIALLEAKKLELEKASEAAEKLKKNLVEMEASISEKDAVISKMTGELKNMKIITNKKEKEKAVVLSRVSKSVQENGASMSTSTGTSGRSLRSVTKKCHEISGTGLSVCSSKSQGISSASNAKTSILFSSNLKVPKLKSTMKEPSPRRN